MADTIANDKVTVRFESTLKSPDENPLLFSGPIEVFAVVDSFEDLLSNDMKNLIEDYLKDKDEVPSIVVFVNTVQYNDGKTPTPDSQPYRGAYFLYVRDGTKTGALNIDDWQEILLGTHSHSNIEALENLSEIPLDENSKGKFIFINNEGKYDFTESIQKSELPELPVDIKNYKTELENYKKLKEPAENEISHLDAPLNQLADTYDWLRRDENGNYINIAVGNCRQLYHDLIRSAKNLYIKKDSDNNIITTRDELNSIGSLALEAYLVNYDTTKTEKIENVIQDKTNKNRLLLNVKLPFYLEENDKIFLYDGTETTSDVYLDDSIVEVIPVQSKTDASKRADSLNIIFNKKYFVDKEPLQRKLTALVVRDFYGSKMDLIDSNLNLYKINNELIKLYMEGELNRKPQLPKYYLSTDSEGNLCWENKLLPSQTFYHETKNIPVKNLEKDDDGNYLVEFNTNYIINDDQPILLINNYFAFDAIAKIENEKIVWHIKNTENDIYNFDDEEAIASFTLVIIRNTSPGTIANELAKNYINKEDAVEILSHGKIKLVDYAKKSDLIGFADIFHTHSQYALKSHNHDYRYAAYYHTHPELALLIKEIQSGATEEQIRAWLNEQDKKNKALFDYLIEQLNLSKSDDGKYFFTTDENTSLSKDSINKINKYLEDNKDQLGINPISENASVKDAIVLFAELFNIDTVKDSQVLLEDPITSQFNVGGISVGTSFKAGDDLRKLLTQMLNPFIDIPEAKKILTPVYVKLKWYEKMSGNEGLDDEFTNDNYYYEINPKELLNYKLDDKIFYFVIDSWVNEKGEPCSMVINKLGQKVEQKTIVEIENDSNKYHPYKITDIDDLSKTADIEFIWHVESGLEPHIEKNLVYDNYGLKPEELLPQTLKQKPEFEYGVPAIFIGAIEDTNPDEYPVIPNDIYKTLQPDFLNKKLNYTFDVTNKKKDEFVDNEYFNNLLLILVEESIGLNEDLVIRNVFTGNRIEDFFVQVEADTEDKFIGFNNGNKECVYIPMIYNVQTTNFQKLEITIERLTKVGGET